VETFNFNSLNLKKIKKVIDVGCGNGRHLKSLGFRLTDSEIVGIDQSVSEITKLNEEFSDSICKNGNTYRFITGDIREMEIPDNSQDLVVCSEVLEHVPNFEAVLEECYRILKPGSVMLISVPAYFPESLCWKYSKKYMQTPGGHIRIFKKNFLKERFEALNLKVFKQHREHALHSIYWILRARNNMEENDFLKSFHNL
jgi:Methylase involved in ubiquinone/menaquinone biosynthesis